MRKQTVTPENGPILLGDYSLFSILAFVVGFLFWPVGFVFGLMALSEMRKYPGQINEGSKYLAWFGMLFQPLLSLFAFALFKSFMWNTWDAF